MAKQTGLAKKVLEGDVRAAARLITALENDAIEDENDLELIYRQTGRAHVVGITGSPGTGKSSLVNALTEKFRKRSLSIGVIGVDPTSPFTGGAILGDRIRMQFSSVDPGVFIRSLATRGWPGGLARAVTGAVHVLDAMGKDIIFVETAGTGQSEVDVIHIADTTVLVLAPGLGDEIQMLKAGIMEIADIYAVNQADREGAAETATRVEAMLEMKTYSTGEWRPPVILTEATSGKGADRLADAIREHGEFLRRTGQLEKARREKVRQELINEVQNHINDFVRREAPAGSYLEKLLESCAERRESPRAAALKIIGLLAEQIKSSEP